MRGYSSLGYDAGSLPVTEQAALEIFSLPMYPSLTDDEQDRVCEALREILSSLG
jgi:aminotransferase EvaB